MSDFPKSARQELTEFSQPDEPREEALRAAIDDLALAAVDPDSNEDELTAAMEAIRQVPVDTQRMLDALHVPDDAGEYERALRSLLARIPDGWGRWIECGPGRYPILARLEERLRQIDPDYQVHQIKEKFGTLRFYWASHNLSAGEVAVAEAEAESERTCERCGNPGRLRKRNGWFRTVCDDCAQSGGYADLPPDDEDE